ncbi:MAG: hypothetical protein PHR60_01890, partial [Eubacteriales bacterium]|nr:hypothetical protein [Eubacteriales bacterium]
VVRPEDHNELANLIINLYYNRDRLKTFGANGRAYAINYLSRERATKEYFKLLTELAERRG